MQLCIKKLELFRFWQVAGQQREGRTKKKVRIFHFEILQDERKAVRAAEQEPKNH